jgi:hypothetical protein
MVLFILNESFLTASKYHLNLHKTILIKNLNIKFTYQISLQSVICINIKIKLIQVL